MRIAVCLSGAERLGSEALTLLARNLPKKAKVDWFCFFWEGGPLGDEAALAELIGRKVEGRFDHLEVQVGRNFVLDFDIRVQRWSETNIENTLRMFRGIRRCNEMKLRRETDGGFVYDHVIRARGDVLVSTPLDLDRFLPLTREFIVFPDNGHYRGGLNDQFAFGASPLMDIYASVAPYIKEYCTSGGCVFHPETLLRHHLTQMRIYPLKAPITTTILRDPAG